MGLAQALPIVSGALLILAGFYVGGLFPRLEIRLRSLEARLGGAFGALGSHPGAPTLLAAGMLWGLLPCPMVLVPALGSAVSGGAGGPSGAVRGFLIMTGFGLGTAPALIAAGLGGDRLLKALRAHWHPAWMGMLLVALGAGLIYAALRMGCPAHGHC